MAKSQSRQTDVFDEFEGSAERAAAWVRARVVPLAIGLVLLLAGVWAVQLWLGAGRAREERASRALEETRSELFRAMGARPGALELPRLANPEADARIRGDFADRFREVAEEHPGTVAATLAEIEAVDLSSPDPAAATAALEALLERSLNDPLRGVVLERLGQLHEEAAAYDGAARAYQSAADLEGYPARAITLANAARCFSLAGEVDSAREAYRRLTTEFPEYPLPDYQRAQARELGVERF